MNDDQRREDMEEADRLTEAAASMKGQVRDELLAEAAQLRAKWYAPKELVALAEVSASTRESDLEEADRLSAVASGLRAGSASRAAVESEAAALRAKWPDFSDDDDGQIRRIQAYLISRGLANQDVAPARSVIARLVDLEAQVARISKVSPTCFACGVTQPGLGTETVNTSLLSAVKHFEIDEKFRMQVLSGQVQPGESTSPWAPGSPPHRGPGPCKSPCDIATLSIMVRQDPNALGVLGPKLKAAMEERGHRMPSAPKSNALLNGHTNGHAN